FRKAAIGNWPRAAHWAPFLSTLRRRSGISGIHRMRSLSTLILAANTAIGKPRKAVTASYLMLAEGALGEDTLRRSSGLGQAYDGIPADGGRLALAPARE